MQIRKKEVYTVIMMQAVLFLQCTLLQCRARKPFENAFHLDLCFSLTSSKAPNYVKRIKKT